MEGIYTLSLGVLYSCILVGSWFFHWHMSWPIGEKLAGTAMILVALQVALSRYFIYWEIDSAGLRERRYWIVKEVAWVEVTHVGSFPRNSPTSDTLEVDYIRGRIVAKPEDRREFISALRRFAPQANFEV
jgi:hypothetical protein